LLNSARTSALASTGLSRIADSSAVLFRDRTPYRLAARSIWCRR